ncbi:MAG TPA: hypothetical protein VFI23_15805 [Rhizomicrobium sp.]|nr:hypothetical protein [Rhizomicrobium sp.]
MRMLPVAFLAVLVTPILATPVFAVPDDPSYPVMPDTPSGTGDPNAVVCRAPQQLPSGGMGPKICLQNNIWVRLSLTGKDLSADGKSVFERHAVDQPTGEGNPDSVTCRKRVPLTASRIKFGPEVCLTNRQWKDIADKNMSVNTAGEIVMRPVGPAGDGAFPITTVERSPPL